ncbi:MAG: ATP-NAD kinase family protein [Pseudomonadota bacterium]
MLTFALLVNPVAGIGGAVGLKGSDGTELQGEARARGGRPRGRERAARALEAMGDAAGRVRWLTWGGDMGATALADAHLPATVEGAPGATPTAADTRAAARALRDAGADLLVFCGGDGTARDLLAALGESLPVLGVPSGVKMHSGVFAATPESAGDVLRALVEGGLVRAAVAEVRDLDEAALRGGEVRPRYYGEVAVPEIGGFLQRTKESGRENEALALEEIVAEVVERIDAQPGIYVLGPGSSVAAVKVALGMAPTLVGVDVLRRGEQVGRDVNAAWLEGLLADAGPEEPVVAVLSFTRHQGFLLGRGNQQLSPAVLERIGRRGLWVIGTRSKLLTLDGRALLVDTDDPALDRRLAGLVEVITGYQDSLFYRVDVRP